MKIIVILVIIIIIFGLLTFQSQENFYDNPSPSPNPTPSPANSKKTIEPKDILETLKTNVEQLTNLNKIITDLK